MRKGQPIKNRLKKFSVYYINIRGIKSKISSLRNVIDELQPTMFCITETHLIKKEDIKIEGYKIKRNDRDKDGGGIMIGIQKKLKNIITIVEKHRNVEESLWMVIDNKQVAIRVGVIYAPQESRTAIDGYEEMYQNIEKQILLAKQNNQKLMLMGDFNCKIGHSIKGNNAEVSKSGKFFNKMVENNKLLVLNAMEKCSGTWTREEGGSKSVLDYLVINQGDERDVVEMMVDEEKEFAPETMNTENDGVTSDHNAIKAELNWLIETQKIKQAPRTTITKKGYKKIEEGIKERGLINIFNKDEPVEKLYLEFKEEVNQLVEKNQTKVKKINRRKSVRMLIKAKKSLRKKIKEDRENLDRDDKYRLVARMKIIEEAIKDEGHKQYQQKIEKVVNLY